MKKRQLSSLVKPLCILLGISAVISSCKKDDGSASSSQAIAKISATQVSKINELNNMVLANVYMANSNARTSTFPPCASAQFNYADTESGFPLTITADFGNGCTLSGSDVEKGKIIYTFGENWGANSFMDVQFIGYSQNKTKIDGSYKIKNTSKGNTFSFSVEMIDLTVTDSTNKTYKYNFSETCTQIAGTGTVDPSDDKYQITGSATITTQGEKWDWLITSPLTKSATCEWIQSGTGLLKYNNKDITVDYGNGSCDNKATITIDGNKSEITFDN